ncbi:MAG: SRPBCC domain-containing protein [Phycisphaerales bacterium]|nr:SRPBCC domain-containing protein [Phycisphaerales bacterium]
MVRREETGIWVTLRETITAHHEEVFSCFTTAAGLTRWFPVAAEIDLRVEGGIVLGWDAKFFRRMTVRIVDFDAGGRIAWRWPIGHEGEETKVTWSIDPDVERGAQVVMRMGPFGDDPNTLIAMADDLESWRWYLCNLRTVLDARVDMRAIRPL